jgi:RNA polymerase sigma factor (sigma-70 family)
MAKPVVPLTDGQRQVVEDNMKLVPHILGKIRPKFDGGGYSLAFSEFYEDVEQSGYEALARATQSYDPERAKFSTYAGRAIYLGMIRCIAKHKNGNVAVSWHRVLTDNPIHEYVSTDAIDTSGMFVAPEAEADAEARDFVAVSERICYPYPDILNMVYLEGETIRGASRRLGLSYASVKRMHDASVELLQRMLEE